MSIFDIFYLLYIAITQSLFVQIFAILLAYISSWYLKQPTKKWYDYDEES